MKRTLFGILRWFLWTWVILLLIFMSAWSWYALLEIERLESKVIELENTLPAFELHIPREFDI